MTAFPIDLRDEQIEQIAELVANRVVEWLRADSAGDLIDAAEVARLFSLSRDYVYEHADDLGAVRIGSGPKPRLRFDPAKVTERLAGSGTAESHSKGKPVRPVRSRGGETLLPIRGESL